MSSSDLSPAQAHALFDILVHHELYGEIENFKWPEAIDDYGYPFKKDDGVQTTSPLLQTLLNKFVLQLPGLKRLPVEFWQNKARGLVYKLAEAELSESYDKGAIGSRKTLATATSAVLEYVARGVLGGYPKKEKREAEKPYDTSKSEDVVQAWEDLLQKCIYEDGLDELFKKTAETGKLEEHSNLVQAAHEYILLNLASFMHHVFIMSPDGQYLLKLIENVHRLVPYMVIRQTLRVGNAATMINGMIRLMLTKVSVGAVTNWIGWSTNADDGMNLLQQILNQVMAWDTSEFQKRATKLEKSKDAPDKKVLEAIKSFVRFDRSAHESAREKSIKESKSIITVILESSEPPVDGSLLKDNQHDVALEFYSTLLSIRDREQLTKILCKLQPDILTSAVREGVSAFDPIIRAIHNAVDLSGTVTDAENFINDLIKISKPKNKNTNGSRPSSRAGSRASSRSSSPAPGAKPVDLKEEHTGNHLPSVEDFVTLLRKHIPSSHKFLHQIAKNGPEVTKEYVDYAKHCAVQFREPNPPLASSLPNDADKDAAKTETKPAPASEPAAGAITPVLSTLFSTLPEDTRQSVLPLIDKHSAYLNALKKSSVHRLDSILSPSKKHTFHGPGMYLVRWHALIDATLITPAVNSGPVRRGWEVKGEMSQRGKVSLSSGKGNEENRGRRGSLSADGTVHSKEEKKIGEEEVQMVKVIDALGEPFKDVLRGLEVMGPE